MRAMELHDLGQDGLSRYSWRHSDNWTIEPVVGDTSLTLSCSCLQQTNTAQRVFCMSQVAIMSKPVHAVQPSLLRLILVRLQFYS